MHKNINFSFVLPSLGNRKLLTKMLDSFERTTKHKKQIEFLIALDEGKLDEIRQWFREDEYSFNVSFCERPRTKDFTNDYYNFLASRCHGDNVVAFNDDAWMRTKDWDAKILKKIKQYGWGIYMVDILDTARVQYVNQFPCFPCVSRRAMNTLGFLLHRDVPMYPADQGTWLIYYHAKRVIPIWDVLVEHEHVSENDPSKARMMDIFRESMKENPTISYGDYTYKIAVAGAGEATKKQSKLNRILEILQEK